MGARWPSTAGESGVGVLVGVGERLGNIGVELLEDVLLLLDFSGVALDLCLFELTLVIAKLGFPLGNPFVGLLAF